MEVTGKFFIVEKHRRVKGKLARRRFSEQDEINRMIELATGYANERGQDFLIVQDGSRSTETKRNERGGGVSYGKLCLCC